MKKILFFARDPGGANVIIPVYEKMREKYQCLLYAKQFAYKRMKQAGMPVIDITTVCGNTQKEIMDLLKKVEPQMIVTGTSLDDYTERYFWKAAGKLHIKSFAILDQWMNLGIRFSNYTYDQMERYNEKKEHPFLPDHILVMDELARTSMLKEGIEKERVEVTGQPHFDTIWEAYEKADACYSSDAWNVVFASEPISEDYDNGNMEELYWGYNEKTIFQSLYQSMGKMAEKTDEKIRVIVRPHPRENKEKWTEILKECENPEIELVFDMKNDSFSILKNMNVVCGMSSMFLLEAMICEKTICSIQIGLKRENPFILDRIGISKSVRTREELLKRMEHAFEGQKENKEKKDVGFHYIRNASERVVEYIEREMTE